MFRFWSSLRQGLLGQALSKPRRSPSRIQHTVRLGIEPLEDRLMLDGGLGTGLTQSPALLQPLAANAQTTSTTGTYIPAQPPGRGSAVEGKPWTFEWAFNPTNFGRKLKTSDFEVKIDWDDGKKETIRDIKDSNGVYRVTRVHKYDEDGSYQIKVTINIINPRYRKEGWKKGTRGVKVWEAPVRAVVPSVTGQQGVPLKGVLVAEFISEDPTPRADEFSVTVGAPPGVWATPLKAHVTQSGGRIRVKVDGTPAAPGKDPLNVALYKVDKKGKIVQSLGQVRHQVNVARHDVTAIGPSWVRPAAGQTVSYVKATVKSVGYTGRVSVRVFQSADGKYDPGDRPLGPATTIQLKANTSATVQLVVNQAPDRGRPINCIVVVDEANRIAESNEQNNGANLAVREPLPLSYEVERDTPLADRRADRVALWLAKHRGLIKQEAARWSIPPEAIAGAIAWEALVNVDPATQPGGFFFSRRGPGKVHFDDGSAAAQVERVGGVILPAGSASNRQARVQNTTWAIKYIAAIMGTYAAEYDRAYVYVYGPNIPNNPVRGSAAILATFYQGVSVERTKMFEGAPVYWDARLEIWKTYVRPGNAFHRFVYKLIHKDSVYTPNAGMGAWVQANQGYLTSAVK